MLTVLVAVGAAPWESDFVASLEHQRGMRVVRRCVDIADLLAAASSGRAQAALVSTALVGLDADAVSRLADRGVEAIGVVTGGSSSQAARLKGLSISVLVDAEAPEAIATALTEAEAGRGQQRADLPSHPDEDDMAAGAPPQRGSIIAVWGPSGGAGRSTVALGLATELSEGGASTMLIDADVYGGSVAAMLAMLDESSWPRREARTPAVSTLTRWPSRLVRWLPRSGCLPVCRELTVGPNCAPAPCRCCWLSPGYWPRSPWWTWGSHSNRTRSSVSTLPLPGETVPPCWLSRKRIECSQSVRQIRSVWAG